MGIWQPVILKRHVFISTCISINLNRVVGGPDGGQANHVSRLASSNSGKGECAVRGSHVGDLENGLVADREP